MKVLGRGERETLILSATVSEVMKLLGTSHHQDVNRLVPGNEVDIRKALDTARILELNGNQVQRCADELQKFVDKLREYDPE